MNNDLERLQLCVCVCVCVCVCAAEFYYRTKRDTESFWHRHQKRVESAPLANLFKASYTFFRLSWKAAIFEGKILHSACVLSCVWLCDPMNCSPPGSSVQGIFQARILEWVAIAYSKYWTVFLFKVCWKYYSRQGLSTCQQSCLPMWGYEAKLASTF